jgi:ribosome-associated toxin RatA of RatAB toxin-antitoxin module
MTKISRSALVMFTDQQMFDLVNDVEKYPEFLPWCRQVEVIERSSDKMIATIVAQKAGVSRSFTTSNQMLARTQIIMDFQDGPFEHLHGVWTFKALGESGSKVALDLDFNFKRGLVNFAFKKMFEPAADSMMKAFVCRAENVYDQSGE